MQIIGPLLIGAPRLAGGIVGVNTYGFLLGGLHGHDSEMWSREWQLEHQPSVLLAEALSMYAGIYPRPVHFARFSCFLAVCLVIYNPGWPPELLAQFAHGGRVH